jgi:hypothetical protein
VIPATEEAKGERISLRPALGKNSKPYLKITKTKKGWRCGSSDRALVTKCEALSSNPSTNTNKRSN